MHIDASDPGFTLVEDRPVFVPGFCFLFAIIGAWLLGARVANGHWDARGVFGEAVALFLGGLGFLCTARRASYRFESATRRLTWTRRTLLGTSTGAMPFEEIERVFVDCGPDPNDTTYRVILFTASGVFPLNHGYTSGVGRLREAARAIEDALTRRAA